MSIRDFQSGKKEQKKLTANPTEKLAGKSTEKTDRKNVGKTDRITDRKLAEKLTTIKTRCKNR